MAIGAVLSLVILLKFGKNARTDGFFAAYAVYGVVIIFAQSLRTTVVPRLLEEEDFHRAIDRFLGGALLLGTLGLIPFVLLGRPLAAVLTGELGPAATDTAQLVLAILWVAAAAQLLAGLGAAALGTRGSFAPAAFAFLTGGLISLGAVFGLSGPLGIPAVGVAVALGSLTTAGIIAARLVRSGYRPKAGRVLGGRSMRSTASLMGGGAISYIVGQASTVVTLGFAARVGEGSVTLLTYALVATSVLIAASTSAIGLVLAAPLSETWDRDPRSLVPYLLDMVRTGLIVAVPAFAIAIIAGDEIGVALLGSSLTEGDVRELVHAFVALGGVVIAGLASGVPQIAAFASSRYRGIALCALIASVAQIVFLLAVLEWLPSLEALAGATSAGALVGLGALLALVWGRSWTSPALLLATELGKVLLLGAVAFGAAGAIGMAWGGGTWDLVAGGAGAVIFALLLPRALPAYWSIVTRSLEPVAQKLAARRA